MENLPAKAQKFFYEGLAAFNSGRFYEAVDRYRECVNVLTANSPESKTTIAKVYWNLGDAYAESGQLNDAIWAYNKSLNTEITKSIAGIQFFKIAQTQSQMGLFRDAVKNLKKCLQYPMPMDGPPHCDILMNLGISLTEVFDAEKDRSCLNEAVQVLEQAVRLYPNDPELREQLRISRHKLNSFQAPVGSPKPISPTTSLIQDKSSSKIVRPLPLDRPPRPEIQSPAKAPEIQSLAKEAEIQSPAKAEHRVKDKNTQFKKILYAFIGIAILAFIIFGIFMQPVSVPKDEQRISIAIVSAQVANIRSGSSQNNSIVAKTQLGDTIVIISESIDWLFVRRGNIEGYINNKLVKQQILTR